MTHFLVMFHVMKQVSSCHVIKAKNSWSITSISFLLSVKVDKTIKNPLLCHTQSGPNRNYSTVLILKIPFKNVSSQKTSKMANQIWEYSSIFIELYRNINIPVASDNGGTSAKPDTFTVKILLVEIHFYPEGNQRFALILKITLNSWKKARATNVRIPLNPTVQEK